MEVVSQNSHVILTGIGALAVIFLVKRSFTPKKKRELEKGIVHFYTTAPVWGCPTSTPFGIKLETWLRLVKIPYKPHYPLARGPKGKWPYIELDGKQTADSSFIIELLKKQYNITLDDWLSPEQKSVALAFQRLLEEHLYFAIVWFRWIDDAGWPIVRRDYFSSLPPILRYVVPQFIVRPQVRKQLYYQGIGRHSEEEILAMAIADWRVVAEYLGDKKFFFGDKPSTIDTIIYAFVSASIDIPWENKLKNTVKTAIPNLLAHYQRMKQLVW